MAQFPLDPILSKTLLASVEYGCSEEIAIVVAMLSVEPPFSRPAEKQSEADSRHLSFHHPDGDHLTLLNIYLHWQSSGYSKIFCQRNYFQPRSLNRAKEVRKQLIGILDKYGLQIRSSGKDYVPVQKAITSGFFMHAATRDPTEGFKTKTGDQTVYIHPSSSLYRKSPKCVLYHELVLTSKEYMRNVLRINEKWLVELAPDYYREANFSETSQRKRELKINPLHDRFNDKDAWRLSKRRG